MADDLCNTSTTNKNERDYIPLESSNSSDFSSSEDGHSGHTDDFEVTQVGNSMQRPDPTASGDSPEVTAARDQNIFGHVQPHHINIPLQISSGYIASAESSSGTENSSSNDTDAAYAAATKRMEDSVVVSEFPQSLSSSSAGCAAAVTESLESNCSVDLAGHRISLLASVSQEAFNPTTHRRMSHNQFVSRLPKKSRSADSFFLACMKPILNIDSSHLYNLTTNTKFSAATFLKTSLSLQSFKLTDLVPTSIKVECLKDFMNKDNHGDNCQSGAHSLLGASDANVESKKNDSEGENRRQFLVNLNALYPSGAPNVDYNVFINSESDSDSSALENAVVSRRSLDCSAFLQRSHTTVPLSPSKSVDLHNLTRKQTQNSDCVPKTEVEDSPYMKQSYETIGKDNNSVTETIGTLEYEKVSEKLIDGIQGMAELYFLGDSTCDENESRNSGSESSKESRTNHWNESAKDVNNNYVLTATSSDDSFATEAKFRFSKDLSSKEESLRHFGNVKDSETLIFNAGSKKRVSFNNDYPVYLLGRDKRATSQAQQRSFWSDDELHGNPFKSTMDAASSTDFYSSTDNELERVKSDFKLQQQILVDSEKGSYKLLCDLQSLWMNVSPSGYLPNISPSSFTGEHNLLQQIHLCGFIVEQMGADWRSLISEPADKIKLQQLQKCNRALKKQLESCKIIQNCLEAEINYAAKEKALLNDEVRHLSYQLAAKVCKVERAAPTLYSKAEECGQQSTAQNTDATRSGAETQFASKNVANISVDIGIAENNLLKKREDDFNSIMDCVRDRRGVTTALTSQLDKYQEDVKALRKQIEKTEEDKGKVESSYDVLLQEKDVLIKERNHYESILKLILQEKSSSDFNVHGLLDNLMIKLNSISAEDGKVSRFSLLEGALEAVQQQNVNYREEILQLKDKIANDSAYNSLNKSELQSAFQHISRTVEDLKETLENKTENQRQHDQNLLQIQELHSVATQAKNYLDKSLAEKDEELAEGKAALEEIRKVSAKQQRKIHELHKLNSKLTRETQEHQRNIEQLGSIINQLRQSLRDQKTQYTVHMKSASEEVLQGKDHCHWLQTQVDHLNKQLCDSHESNKAHEKDKSSLAQQVLSADEERKVVDRKLYELKSALQGDTVLRQALIERNEALQMEINRLRRANLGTFSTLTNSTANREGEFINPHSELSTADAISSLNSLPHSDYKPMPVGEKRKNRYTRRGNDVPRTAVSLHSHSDTVPTCHGISGAGAACSAPE